MSERLTQSEIVYQEGQEELTGNGDEYSLTTFIERENYIYSDALTVLYGLIGRENRLLRANYKYHPNGINPFMVNDPGDTFLARIRYLEDPGDYCIEASSFEQFDHITAYQFYNDVLVNASVELSYFSGDAGRISFINIKTPLVTGETPSVDYCTFGGNKSNLYLERGRIRGGERDRSFYPIGVSFGDLIISNNEKLVVIEVPEKSPLLPAERVEVVTKQKGDNVRLLTVSREVGLQRAVLELCYPLSLDSVTTPPDPNNTQAIFQKMQEIRKLLMRLKPVINVGEH